MSKRTLRAAHRGGTLVTPGGLRLIVGRPRPATRVYGPRPSLQDQVAHAVDQGIAHEQAIARGVR